MVYLNKTKSYLLEAIRIVQSIIGVWQRERDVVEKIAGIFLFFFL